MSGILGIFVRNIILLGTDQVEEADRLGDIIRNIMYISSAPAAAPEDVKSTAAVKSEKNNFQSVGL